MVILLRKYFSPCVWLKNDVDDIGGTDVDVDAIGGTDVVVDAIGGIDVVVDAIGEQIDNKEC